MKRTIEHVRRTCPVAEVERGYARAVAEEDYVAAASFRDQGAGLVGWWCGRGETEDEPGGQYGVMMQITPKHGRYVGVSYSARDLAALQERRRRRGGASAARADCSGDAADEDALEPTGANVFELWLEKDGETSELRRRAVRVDQFPVGALDGDDAGVESADAPLPDEAASDARFPPGRGFATALGGFPLSGPIDVDERGGPVERRSSSRSNGGESTDNSRQGSGAASAFAGWRVSNGAVRVSREAGEAGDASVAQNPFPFDVDGVSMEELLSYERQGFMADFARVPGFGETWARLKAEHAASRSDTADERAEVEASDEASREDDDDAADDDDADPDVFEAFGGTRARNAAARSRRREPRDEYFFEKFVINETDGDAGIIDLDDLDDLDDGDDAFDLEDVLSDDDDGVVVDLDAAAAAPLDGRRLDRLPKGLPAAMVADIQRAIEARGMGRAVFPDDGDEGIDVTLDDDPWAVEEMRIPVDMAMDGHHAFRLWSDDDEDDDDAAPGSTLQRVAREAAATEAEIEAAVRRGLSDAKARVAEELRTAANDASPRIPEKGETETVAVNFDAGVDAGPKKKSEPLGTEPGTSPSPPGGTDEKRAAFDAPNAPDALGGDASAMRFSSGSAESVFGAGKDENAPTDKKSAGERFFERLVSSGRDEDEAEEDGGGAEEDSGRVGSDASPSAETEEASDAAMREIAPPRGFISPASFSSASGERAGEASETDGASLSDASDAQFESQSASALIEALGGDADALPLPGKTRFTRVPPSVARRASSDPFDRLYLGAFGPHGPEVLRLVRGRWGDERGVENNCVTAVKLTGDANVPAGAASFRARVGPGDALDSSFSYPEELGVVTRFKGQGRVAKPGFAERNWVDGELLLLDGRGGQLTGGAELGFVWAVPGERRLLILFSSLELPETRRATYLD